MASSTRSTVRAKSSGTISLGRKGTSTSSRTRSTSSSAVVIALGSNLGDRAWNLRRAISALQTMVRIVKVSSVHETVAVDAPAGSPLFLNMIVIGHTTSDAASLLSSLLAIEQRLGRVRTGVRNEPRVIDLDLILYGSTRVRTPELTLPHPRAHERAFVLEPLAECWPAAATFIKRAYDVAPHTQR